jgi:hypothetical protein
MGVLFKKGHTPWNKGTKGLMPHNSGRFQKGRPNPCKGVPKYADIGMSPHITHAQAHAAWRNMRYRCSNPSSKAWPSYGGRGIKVCERWDSFANFLADMGDPPDSALSIDRINNDGDYEPGNCRWATRKEQLENRRITRLLTFKGETKCLSHWAKEQGFDPSVVALRLKLGWSVEEALTTPKRAKRSNGAIR